MRSRYRRHAEAKGLDRKEQKARQATLHPPRLSFSITGAAIMLPA